MNEREREAEIRDEKKALKKYLSFFPFCFVVVKYEEMLDRNGLEWSGGFRWW